MPRNTRIFIVRLGAVFTMFVALPMVLSGCGSSPGPEVGSRDCEVIKNATGDPATHAACDSCQDAACGTDGCEDLPCETGLHVVQGCAVDEDCAEFEGARCGMYSAPDSICSFHPDDV